MSKRYVALIADATASRLLPPARRARLQADARAAAQQLNRRYARVLAARFAVTLGDELQCLLPSPAPLLRLGDQAAAAAALQIDRSAVSHLARRMAWPLVAAGDKMFRTLLETA